MTAYLQETFKLFYILRKKSFPPAGTSIRHCSGRNHITAGMKGRRIAVQNSRLVAAQSAYFAKLTMEKQVL